MQADRLPDIDFKALAAALLAQAHTLLPNWLPGGHFLGHEYSCGSLDGGEGGSLSVNTNKGVWKDFATDEGGADLVSLYAAIHNLDMGKAAAQVAREEGLEDVAGLVKTGGSEGNGPAQPRPRPPAPPPPPSDKEEWHPLRQVPGYAPAPTFRHHARLPQDMQHAAEYRVGDTQYGYVVRFVTSDGGKDTIPYTFCQSAKDGSTRWRWKTWDEPRPLYLPGHALPGQRTVVLVEGEIKAEVLQQQLDDTAPGVYCVASWPGGCKAWRKADWTWLAGATVLLWADCDAKREKLSREESTRLKDDAAAKAELQASKPLLPAHKQPGLAAMIGIGQLLRQTHACRVSLLPIPAPGEVVDGWDARDAIETDGWTGEQLLAFFARAQSVLPDAEEPPKNDAPVGTEGDTPAGGGAAGGKGGGGGGAGDEPPGAGFDALDPDDAEGDDSWVKVGGRRVPGWMSFYYDADKSRWNVSRKLVIQCLRRLPELAGVLGYDELRNTIQCRKAWPWPNARAGELRNSDALLLGDWLSNEYGLPSISKAALDEGMHTVASTQRFHPVREYLAGLQWDGKARLDKWLVHVLGETPDSLLSAPARAGLRGAALLEYLQLVGRFWVLGMVQRVMQPGCKFDYCPVLEGAGGLRKSTLVEVLASSQFYSDTAFEVGRGKDAQEQVQGIWVYEIAELTHFSKSEVGAIKAFISAKVDRYRVAYGTTVESFPRQCVMAGTTNDDAYLRDRTGNRRFWPIPVRHVVNTEWLERARDQLLAEAYALHLQGERYTPSREEEKRLFEVMQDSRLIETAVESDLLHVLTRDPVQAGIGAVVNNHAEFVTMAQLCQALGSDSAKAAPGLQTQITGWLKHEGWERVKKQINGARAWGFAKPRGWPNTDEPDTAAPALPPDVPPAPGPLTAPGPLDDEWDGDAPF